MMSDPASTRSTRTGIPSRADKTNNDPTNAAVAAVAPAGPPTTTTTTTTRVLNRTSSDYYGDVSRSLLPGPPRWINEWMKQRPGASVQQTTQYHCNHHYHSHDSYQNNDKHSNSNSNSERSKTRFASRHHDAYVWPIHDIWANEILMWLLPTHMLTHLIKFTVVLVVLLLGFLFGTWYPSSPYFKIGMETEADSDSDSATAIPTIPSVVDLHRYWPNVLAALCLVAIPIWVYWYYHTTLYAIGKPWMDPRLPAVNRLDMHVPLRLYTSLHAARQGACHVELVSRETPLVAPLPHGHDQTNDSDPTIADTSPEILSSPASLLAPNVWNLDKLNWKFKLLPTVEKALTEVYEDDVFFQDDTMAQFDNKGNTTNSNKDNNSNSNEESTWSDMAVPSNWMFRNGQVPFDKPIYTNQKYPFPCIPPIVPRDNPTGVYRTFISLPDEWLEMDDQEEVEFCNHSWRDSEGDGDGIGSPFDETTTTIPPSSKRSSYTLMLHGIESACFVYWNGELIGFCKDSRLPSEFVIPHHHLDGGQHHHPTSHVLHLVVVRWSDGSYVEDQDHWWMAGVHRSVELIRRPAQADIVDFQVLRATAEGQLHVRVVTRNRGGVFRRARGTKQTSSSPQQQPQRSITVRLFQDDQQLPGNKLGNKAARSSSVCWKPAPSEIWSATQTVPDQADDDLDVPHKKKTGPNMNTTTLHFETTIENLQLWSAETPSLYTLVIEQQDKKQQQLPSRVSAASAISKTTQVESCRVGFRSVEINKEGILHVNGKRITICGINRHEHDPDQGKVVSLDRMKQDIVTLKKNNFNAIRCSHYPTHTSFYRLCDYYGMYVCDEANIETHGLKPMGRLAQDWGWENTFVSRVCRMVQRDFNHPSIIFWSLGNEAGRGRNFSLARELVLGLDETRPICYESGGSWAEGVGRTELTDVICCMYPDVNRTKRLAQREDEDRPVILCEYSHSMNNSNGNIHLYWEAFWNAETPRLQGGFIWDMIDQGLRKRTDQGIEYFAYGGDFGDVINDAQFCINGMFTPDREPHPSVSEIKYLQQPVDIVSDQFGEHCDILLDVYGSSVAPVRLSIQNRYVFRDLSHINWNWRLVSDRSAEILLEGVTITAEELSNLDFGIALDKICQVEKLRTAEFGCAYFLNIQGFLAESQSWSEAGHILVSKQFSVSFNFGTEEPSSDQDHRSLRDFGPLLVRENDQHIEALRSSGIPVVVISKTTGSIVSVNWDGCDILCGDGGVKPNYTRATTDNDRGGMELVLDFLNIRWAQSFYRKVHGLKDFSHEFVWKLIGLSQDAPPKVLCHTVKSAGSADRITIEAHCRVISHRKATLFEQAIIYDIYRDGSIRISTRVTPRSSILSVPSLPRVGFSFVLDPSLSHIQYFGRGPEENYPDRKSGSWKGIWNSRPSQIGYNYIVPSENGNRSDCEWVAFHRGDDGHTGIIVVAEPGSNFNFSALLNSAIELQHASHTYDLDRREDGIHPVHVNIDHKLMGLAGDVSWFPCVYPEFLVKAQEYNYSFYLLPLSKGDDAPAASRRIPVVGKR